VVEKRYQVFVSSTYEDLQEERREVMQALLELDCIPAGMELFPAADEDQWTLIREVIADSDYYIVIIGGRYGSVGPQGISFTEMEYRYAVDAGKPVLAFLHGNPSALPALRVEADAERREKLEMFRSLARRKVCRHWTSAAELGGLVSRSMLRLMKHSPAVGWVRADQVPSAQAMQDVLEMQRRLEAAERKARDSVMGAKDVGLERAVTRQGDFGTEADWLAVIASAVERVDLMGRTLYGWTESSDAAELIVRKIRDEHVRFRWLVMAPDNHFLSVLEENQVSIGADLRMKLSVLTEFLRNIQEELPEVARNLLEVRTFRTVPLYFSFVRIDDRFFITHYMCSSNSGGSPLLVVSDVGTSWPRAYAKEFETIWRLSEPSDGEPCADGVDT
jgi:hypothetical protein